MKKKLIGSVCVLAAATLLATSFAGCGNMDSNDWGADYLDGSLSFVEPEGAIPEGNYQYESVVEQKYNTAAETPSSYFSLDRNTAGYALARAQINAGMKISKDSVRTEELVNYFTYDYPVPAEGEGIRATAYLSDCPWESGHKLLTVGVRTEEKILAAERNNYVLLVDVSGSMSGSVAGLEATTRLDLVKYGAKKLTQGLGDNDTVSIVTYASGVGCALQPTAATEKGKQKIFSALDNMKAYGSTNGEGGLTLAYQKARENFSEGGNNRVILLTDGDFNVGISNNERLKNYISEQAVDGIYLSVLGVGLGNTRDDFMQTLALNGNGNYAYIDTPEEAEKVLCEELNGMLTVVAKDAKAGITFDSATVEKYRLIGYDTKIMTQEEFEDSSKDAGEIGSNLCVTALYELELTEGAEENASVAHIEIKFKDPETGENKKTEASVSYALAQNEDTLFISCVAEFGLVLRDSAYGGSASLESVLARLNDLSGYLAADRYKTEFVSLVQKAADSGFYD